MYNSMFDNDEKNYMNRCAVDTQKEVFIGRLKLHILANNNSVANENDIVLDMLKGISNKVLEMTDSDWEAVQKELPFVSDYGNYDDEDFYITQNIEV